ncbi:MAG: divergent PAP2 family protein [Clostridia bacterium]|nr:divergent PAP2 family protein [Clostridia bacterium]
MELIKQFFGNPVVIATVVAWFTAQVLKVIIELITERDFELSRLVGAGGMPSSHAAFVTALVASVARVDGLGSTTFAVAMAIALVVMYDAAGVRRASGQHAKLLNWMLDNWYGSNPEDEFSKKMKELIGHTPLEVLAGAALGLVIGLVLPM